MIKCVGKAHHTRASERAMKVSNEEFESENFNWHGHRKDLD